MLIFIFLFQFIYCVQDEEWMERFQNLKKKIENPLNLNESKSQIDNFINNIPKIEDIKETNVDQNKIPDQLLLSNKTQSEMKTSEEQMFKKMAFKQDQEANDQLIEVLNTKKKIYAALSCFNNTPNGLKIKLQQNVSIPVYVPIPVFKYYEIPHYPINQIIRQAIPIVQVLHIKQSIIQLKPQPVNTIQKVFVPRPVPIPQILSINYTEPVYNAERVANNTKEIRDFMADDNINEYEQKMQQLEQSPNMLEKLELEGKGNFQNIETTSNQNLKMFQNKNKNYFSVSDPSQDVVKTLERLWKFKQQFHEVNGEVAADILSSNSTNNSQNKVTDFLPIFNEGNKTKILN